MLIEPAVAATVVWWIWLGLSVIFIGMSIANFFYEYLDGDGHIGISLLGFLSLMIFTIVTFSFV